MIPLSAAGGVGRVEDVLGAGAGWTVAELRGAHPPENSQPRFQSGVASTGSLSMMTVPGFSIPSFFE
jgi:hypothetical protein